MGSKLLVSSRYLQHGVGSRIGRRLLAAEAGQAPCEAAAKETPKSAGSSGLVNRKAAVVGVFLHEHRYELSAWGRELDQKAQGKLTQQLNVLGPNFKVGEAVVVTGVDEYAAVALSCFGPPHARYNELEALDVSRENTRWGVGAGHKALQPYKFAAQQIEYDSGSEPDAVGEAFTLASWTFQKFRHHPDLDGIGGGTPAGAGGHEAVAVGAVRGRAQNWARYLADMPANKMTPVDLAQEAIDKLCPLGIQVRAHDRAWIEANKMQAFLAVARGSCEPPVFLECEYRGLPGGLPGGHPAGGVLLAAKGVTYDCGGLCLKKPEDMVENRGSMAGAAAALGALRALAELKIELNVTLVVPLCENMISGQCMRVGDVVPALDGTNILIEDTDMEGRLMLADALVYGQAKYHPSLVVDVATLTPGIKMATGGGCYGCFSNREELWRLARAAGAATGDRPWRLPLWDYYNRQLVDDPSVDLRNRGSGRATPCIGAAFLKNFICQDWLHFDITGVGKLAHNPPPYLQAHRMSGRPTRALLQTLVYIADGAKAGADGAKAGADGAKAGTDGAKAGADDNHNKQKH